MNIQENWSDIRAHFNRSVKSSFHVSIASVNSEGQPIVTPIGSLFLNKELRGFYFEKYTSNLPLNAKQNKNICVLAVNSNLWFWVRSLIKVKFINDPAVKLYGVLGEKRKASEIELSRLKKRTKLFKISKKGYDYLWGDMCYVREVEFTKAEKIKLGKMTG
jgi:hypothetical protein